MQIIFDYIVPKPYFCAEKKNKPQAYRPQKKSHIKWEIITKYKLYKI